MRMKKKMLRNPEGLGPTETIHGCILVGRECSRTAAESLERVSAPPLSLFSASVTSPQFLRSRQGRMPVSRLAECVEDDDTFGWASAPGRNAADFLLYIYVYIFSAHNHLASWWKIKFSHPYLFPSQKYWNFSNFHIICLLTVHNSFSGFLIIFCC